MDERRLQFPITDSRERFDAQRSRLRSLSEGVRAAIERVQPYHRRHEKVPPLLALVRDIDDADKHRLLNVVFQSNFEGQVSSVNYPIAPGETIEVAFERGPLKHGTALVAIRTPRSHPKMDYRIQATLGLSVQHAIGPSGVDHSEVAAIAALMTNEVVAVIDSICSAV